MAFVIKPGVSAECYEAYNPAFPEMTVSEQAEAGVCHYVSLDSNGRLQFGQSRAQAMNFVRLTAKPLPMLVI